MSEAVTDIIVARSRDAEGLTTTVLWSIAAHIAAVALFVVLPAGNNQEAPPV